MTLEKVGGKYTPSIIRIQHHRLKESTNDRGLVSEHRRSAAYSHLDGDRLTKILTKTARLPTAINDARAPQVRRHPLLRNGLWRSAAASDGSPSKGLWIS